MKRVTITIAIGAVFLLVLYAGVVGERVVSDDKKRIGDQPSKQPVRGVAAETNAPSVGVAEDYTVEHLSTAVKKQTMAGNYQIPWQSINAGGGPGDSDNYLLNGSVSQPLPGAGSSDQYQVSGGYWHVTGPGDCDCGVWGDVTGDGNINPVDVVFMVNKVYLSNDMLVQHPNCPRDAADINCDGNVNPVDVVFFVNRVYLSNDMFCINPCI